MTPSTLLLRSAVGAAAVVAAAAQGWSIPQTPGMVITSYPTGIINNPGGEPPGTIGLTAQASPFKHLTWTPTSSATSAQLLAATSGQCHFLESAFEDGFQYPSLNLTRWMPIAATSLDHCPTPGAVGAANAATCTAMMGSQIQLGVKLPGYPTGDLGMIMTLSQKPCLSGGACCVGSSCANWAGAHLSSLGCIQYGVLETEAAFNIPAGNGGVFFAGTYIYSSSNGLDPSWNEVDQTIINGPAGLEFHGSLFISNPPTQSNAQEDKDVFDSTGTQCNSYVPPAGQPGNLKGKSTPYSCPLFGTVYAQSYHTYKIVWTPTWIAWMIDTTVYRNSTSAPWRPVTMRPLLRTNVGTAASVATLPDANVYVRRIRYTPLNWPGTTTSVIQDALTLPSMASKYGPLSNPASGSLQMSTPTMVAAASSGRRHLLQLGGSGPQISSATGNILSDPTNAAPPLVGYQAELARVSNITAAVVSQAIPGVSANMVATSITGHVIAATLYVSGIAFSQWTPAVQQALVTGLAAVVVPDQDNVFITSFADASLPASWTAANTAPPTGSPGPNTAGVLVSYMVDGYSCTALAQLQPAAICSDAGFALATADSIALNNVGPSSSAATAITALLPAAKITDVSGGNGYPQIAASVSVSINVFYTNINGSSVTPTSIIEASFDSMLNSGMLAQLLAAQGIFVASPTNAQTARLTKAADAMNSCPVAMSVTCNVTLPAACPATMLNVWKGVSIAFVIGFGVVMLLTVAYLVIHSRTLSKQLIAVQQERLGNKISPESR